MYTHTYLYIYLSLYMYTSIYQCPGFLSSWKLFIAGGVPLHHRVVWLWRGVAPCRTLQTSRPKPRILLCPESLSLNPHTSWTRNPRKPINPKPYKSESLTATASFQRAFFRMIPWTLRSTGYLAGSRNSLSRWRTWDWPKTQQLADCLSLYIYACVDPYIHI